MRIGELAHAAGTTVRALRYYEQQGLLRPDRSPNGYRLYGGSQVTRVANIRLLLSLGLTATDIRAFLPCLGDDIAEGPVCPASAAVIARRLAEVDDRIAALDTTRTRLVDALARAGAEKLARAHEAPRARTTG
ncbi:MerR family transcriptional regulator [Streptomyces radicis]|uniref:MerR family transcriptional regulator n=1 Tax=Streptomyces radicis TaxID=1750517 RepID=A0A3A9VS10_9ACTN|nr:MerR family transcriptional regulator [Streptomyces radicis]RKN03530.1 MerR family transcriptional regulator [Streptomyces radicis]RKN20358.1 MerR family transcriptional regulator [Streptomyces radicis]